VNVNVDSSAAAPVPEDATQALKAGVVVLIVVPASPEETAQACRREVGAEEARRVVRDDRTAARTAADLSPSRVHGPEHEVRQVRVHARPVIAGAPHRLGAVLRQGVAWNDYVVRCVGLPTAIPSQQRKEPS
jgi:hypothetical protein